MLFSKPMKTFIEPTKVTWVFLIIFIFGPQLVYLLDITLFGRPIPPEHYVDCEYHRELTPIRCAFEDIKNPYVFLPDIDFSDYNIPDFFMGYFDIFLVPIAMWWYFLACCVSYLWYKVLPKSKLLTRPNPSTIK